MPLTEIDDIACVVIGIIAVCIYSPVWIRNYRLKLTRQMISQTHLITPKIEHLPTHFQPFFLQRLHHIQTLQGEVDSEVPGLMAFLQERGTRKAINRHIWLQQESLKMKLEIANIERENKTSLQNSVKQSRGDDSVGEHILRRIEEIANTGVLQKTTEEQLVAIEMAINQLSDGLELKTHLQDLRTILEMKETLEQMMAEKKDATLF